MRYMIWTYAGLPLGMSVGLLIGACVSESNGLFYGSIACGAIAVIGMFVSKVMPDD